MFLTADELYELTGLRQAAAQIRWLQRNGVEHYVRADGKVRVRHAAFGEQNTAKSSIVEPDFEALSH